MNTYIKSAVFARWLDANERKKEQANIRTHARTNRLSVQV